jgi:baculoviral IAP repeat-containing protein 6
MLMDSLSLICSSQKSTRLVPPKVTFRTTHNGAYRFNPNLYACGYVCLSLLGTWSAVSACEQWNPEKSSLLQVLLSIQSLILVPHPYFNEPGYGSVQPKNQASLNYNSHIRKYTLQAGLLTPLTTTEQQPVWRDLYKAYWKFKGTAIARQCDEWARSQRSLSALSASVKKALEPYLCD